MNTKLLLILALIGPASVSADCLELVGSIRAKTGSQANSAKLIHDSVKPDDDMSAFKDKLDQYAIDAAGLAGLNMRYDAECANPPVSVQPPSDVNLIQQEF